MSNNVRASVWKLRLGVVLFVIWWIPIYLTAPAVVDTLGYTNNTHAKHIIIASILLIQGIVGVIGLLLVGKQLALTLRKVDKKRLPAVTWRMFIRGDATVYPSDLKVKKKKKPSASLSGSGNDKLSLTEMLKSKDYIKLLVIAAILGVPISAAAYYFLAFINHLQSWVYFSIPSYLGFKVTPSWWVLLPMLFAGVFVGLAIKYLPGKGGHVPAEGFKSSGYPLPAELPGIILAAIASIGLGAVIGPEAPLIALGGGLGYLAIKLVKRNVPSQTGAVVAATGSFAAISTLLGSPLLGAFLLMEASGLGGDTATLVLMPGLLGAGIGSLIFIGLGNLTGLGTMSLVIPGLPHFAHPTLKEFLWAIAIGLAAALLGTIIKKAGLKVSEIAKNKTVLVVIASGLVVATAAILYASITGHSFTDVLFSGQSALPYFIDHASSYSLSLLIALLVFKSLAYGISLGSFRGGPIFPSMFIGAIGGIALSHLPGLPLVPAVAMGIGALAVSMLRLPMTSVLLATLLLLSDGLSVMPLVIVAVVVSFIASSRLLPVKK